MLTLTANRFLGTLTNLLAIVETADTFESGNGLYRVLELFRSTDIDSGAGKVVNAVDVLTVEDLDLNRSPWTIKAPTVDQQQFDVDDYKVVPLSLSRYLLKGAFAEESALAYFIGYVRSVMQKTKDIYMYKELLEMIFGWYLDAGSDLQAGQTITVNLKNYTGTDSEKALGWQRWNANQICREVINFIKKIGGADSAAYNELGYTEIVDPKSLVFLVNSDYDTDLVIDTFASLFKSQEIKDRFEWGETVPLPANKIETALTGAGSAAPATDRANCIGIIAHADKFQYGFFYQVMASIFNPANLTDQDFMHFAYYLGAVKALAGVKIVASYTTVQ